MLLISALRQIRFIIAEHLKLGALTLTKLSPRLMAVYYNDDYYYGGGCYIVRQRVLTRYGWRIRRIQICE